MQWARFPLGILPGEGGVSPMYEYALAALYLGLFLVYALHIARII
jgi:hypothetical protein